MIIKLDYHGKRLSMSKGALQGFIIGMSQLSQTQIRLKELHLKQGSVVFCITAPPPLLLWVAKLLRI